MVTLDFFSTNCSPLFPHFWHSLAALHKSNLLTSDIIVKTTIIDRTSSLSCIKKKNRFSVFLPEFRDKTYYNYIQGSCIRHSNHTLSLWKSRLPYNLWQHYELLSPLSHMGMAHAQLMAKITWLEKNSSKCTIIQPKINIMPSKNGKSIIL